MREQIKRYELNKDVTVEKLKENGFKEGGIMKELVSPKYHLNKCLVDDIEMLIEIDTTLAFDDTENILVLDDDFCQAYGEFYNKEADDPFLNKVITKYNQVMDELVDKGIFHEKRLEKEQPKDMSINYQIPFPVGTYLEREELNGKKHIDRLHHYTIDEAGLGAFIEVDALSLFAFVSPKIDIDYLLSKWHPMDVEKVKEKVYKKKKTK